MLKVAASYLTVLTNVMVTTTIGFYLFRERRALAKLQVPSIHLKLYTGVMAILVESALPLSLAGVIFATLYLVTTSRQGTQRQLDPSSIPLETTFTIFSFLFYAFCVSLHCVLIRATSS